VATVLVWVLLADLRRGRGAGAGAGVDAGQRPEAGPQGFEAAVLMTRWMFPYIGFMSLVALSAGVLNTWKRFAVPAATPVLLKCLMIAAAWQGAPWFAGHGHRADLRHGGGVMLGGVLQLAVQIPALARIGPAAAHWPGVGRAAHGLAGPRRAHIAR
jgi:putative peptidoglycan lipid II flippase